MTEPAAYVKKAVPVEAARLEAGVEPVDEDGYGLDPNTRSHAQLAGWMMGNGFRGFRVVGDEPPFGLEVTTFMGPLVAEPGDWIVRDLTHGTFMPVSAEMFAEWFEKA